MGKKLFGELRRIAVAVAVSGVLLILYGLFIVAGVFDNPFKCTAAIPCPPDGPEAALFELSFIGELLLLSSLFIWLAHYTFSPEDPFGLSS